MTPEGIAEKAGMKEGDVILKVNDTSLQEAMSHNDACQVRIVRISVRKSIKYHINTRSMIN